MKSGVSVVPPQSGLARNCGRSAAARLFALLVALLVGALQPRLVAAPAAYGGAAPRVVAQHAPRAETNALRADVAARVAPAPVLSRPPSLLAAVGALRWPSERLVAAEPSPAQSRQPVVHFHSKRRIPRMNSDEPPRT